MQLSDDNETNGFSFVWTIHNFSYCAQKTAECIQSPDFALDNNNDSMWSLELFPRGLAYSDEVGFCILLKESVATDSLRVAYVISIRTVKGTFKKVVDKENNFSLDTVYLSFLTQEEIHERGTEAYLDNDTLTVRCRISEVNGKVLEFKQCYARTVIGVERATYNWNFKNFNNFCKRFKKATKLSDVPSFTMDIQFFSRARVKKFKVIIKRTTTNKLNFSTCVVSLLDTEKVLHSEQYENWFEKSGSEPIWEFSFTPKKKFHSNSLRCEFAVSFGVESSKIEMTEYGIDRPLVCSTQTMSSDVPGSWKDNLRQFYSEGKLSDFTIRTPKKDFPVHKIMLCAQSAVFSAMFEGDMKENRTGIIEIEDLEDDTISMMLLFVYTGVVETLEWGMAYKLYYAAEKYGIAELKDKCSAFCKDNLSTSNACECLILADMYQDHDLKSVSQDFVIEHATDIINSDEWKELMKDKLQLAAETMHLLCVQNLKV